MLSFYVMIGIWILFLVTICIASFFTGDYNDDFNTEDN